MINAGLVQQLFYNEFPPKSIEILNFLWNPYSIFDGGNQNSSPSFGEIPRYIPSRCLMVKSPWTAQKIGAANYAVGFGGRHGSPETPVRCLRPLWGVGAHEKGDMTMTMSEFHWGLHPGFIWVCLKMLCTPLYPMVLLIITPMKNGYFIGNIPHFQTNPYWFIDSSIDSFWIIDNDMGSYSYGVCPVYAVCLLKTLIHGRFYLTLWRYDGDTMGYKNKEWCPWEMKPGNWTYPDSKCWFSAGEIIYTWGLCFFHPRRLIWQLLTNMTIFRFVKDEHYPFGSLIL